MSACRKEDTGLGRQFGRTNVLVLWREITAPKEASGEFQTYWRF
jgi:hypothetical protein